MAFTAPIVTILNGRITLLDIYSDCPKSARQCEMYNK